MGTDSAMVAIATGSTEGMTRTEDGLYQPRWYVAQTRSRHEKRVAQRFYERGVEHFLPSYTSVRRWKDRRVRLELPLFAGYIFVRVALAARTGVLQVPGIVQLVGFGKLPTPIADHEIAAMRNGFVTRLSPEPHPYLTIGHRVRIKDGPLAGLSGVLVRTKTAFRVVISVAFIQRSVAVDIDKADIEPIQ